MNFKRGPYVLFGALGTCLALGGAASLAQQSADPSASPSPNVSSSPSGGPSGAPATSPSASASPAVVDIAAINDAAALNYIQHINNLEVKEGTAAQSKAQGQQAQNLAQLIVSDHQQSEQQVTSLAGQKAIVLAPFQEASYESAVDALLAQLSGAEYDAAFLDVQREDHQTVLQNLQSYLNTVTDPDIQSLIADYIAVVQRHIDVANGAIVAPSPSSSPSRGASARPSPSGSPSPAMSASPSPSPSASPSASSSSFY